MVDDNIENKIKRERTQLLIKYPFFGQLALYLTLREALDIETMATDGSHLFYNPFFVKGLNSWELRTIVAHEILHPALGHIWRKEGRDHDKWNRAADYADNLLLAQEGFRIPSYALYDEKYKGMAAEKIYKILPDGKFPKKFIGSHDKWGSGQNKKPGQNSEDANKEMKDIWRQRLGRAAAVARMHGKLSGNLEKLIKDTLSPKLNWRILLQNYIIPFAKSDYSMIPPNKKHIWRGMYLPSLRGDTLELAVAIDTSGSVSVDDFKRFMAEVRGITEQFSDYCIYLYFCDTEIHKIFTLTPFGQWPVEFPKLDGGTDFRPVFKDIDKKQLPISALVYLSDGDGEYPEKKPHYPVIWLLNSDHRVPWGHAIRI